MTEPLLTGRNGVARVWEEFSLPHAIQGLVIPTQLPVARAS